MTISFDMAGLALPVSQSLLDILSQEVELAIPDQAHDGLTVHFRNPLYRPDTRGVHPVEMRLVNQSGCWRFDYITDFSYQGQGQDAELCKELDFNVLDNEHYLQGWGPLPMAEAQELFTLWQHNFLAYAQLGFFTVTVSGD